jgi:hypothetical protein
MDPYSFAVLRRRIGEFESKGMANTLTQRAWRCNDGVRINWRFAEAIVREPYRLRQPAASNHGALTYTSPRTLRHQMKKPLLHTFCRSRCFFNYQPRYRADNYAKLFVASLPVHTYLLMLNLSRPTASSLGKLGSAAKRAPVVRGNKTCKTEA